MLVRRIKLFSSPWQPAFWAVLVGMSAVAPAYGYIDPNASGFLSQLLTPLLMIAATGVTFFRKQVGSAFRWLGNRFTRQSNERDR
jgi:hypothetical protein